MGVHSCVWGRKHRDSCTNAARRASRIKTQRTPLLATLALAVLSIPTTAGAVDGPSAPEFASFAPAKQSRPIDLFTGDFRYTIPLLEVPGPRSSFPIALSYQSGIGPDQEASWVGLGWSLNPGSITRQLRGLPDDFDGATDCTGAGLSAGDCIATTEDIEPNWTFGLGVGANLEVFGLDSSVGLGLSAGFKGYYNNYRGLGYTRTLGVSGQASASGIAGAVGLNLSLDSQQGLTAAPSLSLGDALSVNASLDALAGLSTLSVGLKYRDLLRVSADAMSFLGYAKPTSLPGPGRDMTGWNIFVSMKGGPETQGAYPNLQASGFYTVQRPSNSGERYSRALGYLHLHQVHSNTADRDKMVLDFNRVNDGPIYDDTPNLAFPVLTHDLYTAAGPGLAGTFRAYRNDIQWLSDPLQTTELFGGAVGVDIGGGVIAKFGVSASLNGTKGEVGGWDGGNQGALVDALADSASASLIAAQKDYERTYFRMIGETVPRAPGAALPGADAAVAVPLRAASSPLSESPPSYFQAEDGVSAFPGGEKPDTLTLDVTRRAPRATLMEHFTNRELDGQAAAFPEFAISRIDLYSDRRPNHIGGFRITAPDGRRFIYAIPVYNLVYEEHSFSVARLNFAPDFASDFAPDDSSCGLVFPPIEPGSATYDHKIPGTERFRHIKKLSPYVVTYLLTAVLGPDYIDADDIPGPSDGDFGDWVRLDYSKQPGQLAWRRPYAGATFLRGPENGAYAAGTQRLSDKAFFTYGEREEWYLSAIHTRTHVARFRIANRDDNRAAPGRAVNSASPPQRGTKRLDRIDLYVKDQTKPESTWTPMTSVALRYDYSLQRGAPGGASGSTGRLTLKRVWTEFRSNSRGALSPYEFDYEGGDAANNPVYQARASDRWGSYQSPSASATTTECKQAGGPTDRTIALGSPYTRQLRAERDRETAVWSLRKIVEPTGRRVTIDYEADDYRFVQDREAMVMTRLRAVAAPGKPSDEIDKRSHTDSSAGDARRIYFDVPPGTDPTRVLADYTGPSRQVYFKIRVALKNGISDPQNGKWETVAGYARAMAGGVDSTGPAPLGWLELEAVNAYHPFSLAAWQHLRLNRPELISANGLNGDPAADPFVEALKVVTMVDFIDEIVTLARGVYPTWFGDNWGQRLDLENSWVRLRPPGGTKIGGGARVRRIEYSDRWDEMTGSAEPASRTGFVYEYRLPDGTSSGVASYEPSDGADENAMREAKHFEQKVLLASAYNLYAESPLAESYFPAPAVGYSRVVERTLASEELRTQARLGQIPTATSTAGPTVHEFFTARDFPVRTSETALDKRRNPGPHVIPIPFLGMITLNSLAASQGYAVELNDMHGKARRTASYEYGPGWDAVTQDFELRAAPVSSTEFRYRAVGGSGGTAARLTAALPVLTGDGIAPINDVLFAREGELFVDTRRNRTESWEAGLNFNVDVILAGFIPIPIPVPVPAMSYSLAEAKTVVAAKVIHQAGLLEQIVETVGPARVVNADLRYSVTDGRPILSSRTNEFGDPVYRYDMPGHWRYPRLGPAYLSTGLSIDLTGATLRGSRRLVVPLPGLPACDETPGASTRVCVPLGSRFAVGSGETARALVLDGVDSSGLQLHSNADMPTVPPGPARLVASGAANRLDVDIGEIRALADPITARTLRTCSWHAVEPCELRYGEQRVIEPTCAALTWVAGLDARQTAAGGAAEARCPSGGDDFGPPDIANARDGILPVRNARNSTACRVALVNRSGRAIDPRALSDIGPARGHALKDTPRFAGLPYSGVAFDARIRGESAVVSLYSDCDGWVRERTIGSPRVGYCSVKHETVAPVITGVLSASATVWRDTWPSVAEDMRFFGGPSQVASRSTAYRERNRYTNGVDGILRPWRTYRYIKERDQSPGVDVRRDGTFTLRAFDWDNPDNPTCQADWRWSSELSIYGASGRPAEERTSIGAYSAAIYAFGRNLPVAIAQNARLGEIAAEGFESYPAGAELQPVETGEGRFRFSTSRSSTPFMRCANGLFDGYVSGGMLVITSAPTYVRVPEGRDSGSGRLPALVNDLASNGMPTEPVYVQLPGESCAVRVTAVERAPDGRLIAILDYRDRDCPPAEHAAFTMPSTNARVVAGGINMYIKCRLADRPRTVGKVAITTERAHTGRQSLRVSSAVEFEQPDLQLTSGKSYVVSAWVSLQDTDQPTFGGSNGPSLQIKFWSGTQELTAAQPPPMRPSGPIINGWQRIEGTFRPPVGHSLASIALVNGPRGSSIAAYFDDVRLAPESALLETIVYERDTLRISARLNAENYATLYGYSADGAVTQIQRETAGGRLTVQEGRTHAAERP